MFGSSRDIAIGPVAVVSLLMGTLLKQEIDPIQDPVNYLKLAFTATFFCGIFQAGLGVFRSVSHFFFCYCLDFLSLVLGRIMFTTFSFSSPV